MYISKVYAFGSSITDRFDPTKSDIDVVVELDIKDPMEYGEALLSLRDKFEAFLKGK